MRNDSERISIVENRLNRLDKYMSTGEDFRTDTAAKLSRLVTLTEGFIDYQEKCDAERLTMKNRIESLERSRARTTGMAIGASTVISAIAGLIGFWKGHP